MTAMIMHSPTLVMEPRHTSGVWRNSFAASLAGALHVGVLAGVDGGLVDGKTGGGGTSGDAHAVRSCCRLHRWQYQNRWLLHRHLRRRSRW